jgi:hypothetical protein
MKTTTERRIKAARAQARFWEAKASECYSAFVAAGGAFSAACQARNAAEESGTAEEIKSARAKVAETLTEYQASMSARFDADAELMHARDRLGRLFR